MWILAVLFLKINLFIYLVSATLSLRCCVRAFSNFSERGLLFVAVHGLLIAVASLVSEQGLTGFSSCGMLWHVGSVVVAHGLGCSEAYGIFPDQGLNPCPLHWQADS